MKLEEEIKKIKSNIEEKIKIFNNNNDYNEYNDYVIEKILLINKIIKTTDFLDTTSEGESEIEKLKTEQFLKNYKIFKSWQVLTKLPVKNLFNAACISIPRIAFLGPVIPISVIYAVPFSKIFSSAV